MSQAQLAGLVGKSEDYIGKIERGERPVDRLSTLIPIADALQVPLSELTGVPPPLKRDPDEQHAVAEAVRMALTGHHFLRAIVAQPAGGNGMDGLGSLRKEAARAWRLTHASEYDQLRMLLPRLIRDCEVAAREVSADEQAEAFRVLANVYQAAAALMAQIGETDVAWVAADRSVFAAERAGDAVLAAAGDFRLGHAFLSGGNPNQAERAAAMAADAIEQLARSGEVPVISLWGALHLVVAVAASRRADARTARRALDRAQEAAARIGTDRNDFGTEFGPTNVALHEVGVAVELGEAGRAVEIARSVDPSWLSPERRGRFLIDLARAAAQRGRIARAVDHLLDAEAVTPDLVHYHALVREMVVQMMRRGHGHALPSLIALTKRMGLAS